MPCTALLLSILAHADVVGPPPRDCPNGSIGQRDHGGSYCEPHTCTHAPCRSGTCETTGLCVVEDEVSCSGRMPRARPCTRTRRVAVGACETDADCSAGTCVVDAYCVVGDEASEVPEAPEAPEATPSASGCLCSSGPGASMVFLLGLLPLTRARRRQR